MRYHFLTLFVLFCLCSIAQKQKTALFPDHQASASTVTGYSFKQVPLQTSEIKPPAHRTCGTVDYSEHLRTTHPGLPTREEFEAGFAKHLAAYQKAAERLERTAADEILKLPVVVHVIHNGEAPGEGRNISQAQVQSQIDVLNEDFRRTGAGANDNPVGADSRIEFFLATTAPDGSVLPEPGINRVDGGQNSWELSDIESTLKPETQWNPEQYLNIWTVEFGGENSDLLGYAQFPNLSGLDGTPDDNGIAETDGVVIGYSYFGRTGTLSASYDQGRTATHEIGHWLGLFHIWGDGGCDVDDYCSDTPLAGDPNLECAENVSCESRDMIENYMDYTPDACMNIFTVEQKARMRTVLQVSPRRKELLIPPHTCEEAVEATAGSNNAPSAPYWFTYTATVNEILHVSSIETTTEDTYVYIYDDCNGNVLAANDDARDTLQSELSIELDANQTVKILWAGQYSSSGFDWDLSTSTPAAGGTCELAEAATVGTNTTPSTDNPVHWFSFTMPDANSKLVISTTADEFVDIYTDTCYSADYSASGYQGTTLFDISQNDEVFIKWSTDNGGDFSWALAVEPLEPGETCSLPATAAEGTNSLPFGNGYYWYSFTVPKSDAWLVINSESGENIYIADSDCETLSTIAEGNTDLSVSGFSAGEEILIIWEITDGGGFSWELGMIDITPGEICSDPVLASEGINSAPSAPYWYAFTMPEAGSLTISSLNLTTEDTYLEVYSDCDGSYLGLNDDFDADNDTLQSKVTLPKLDSGETVYIHWADNWSSAGFDWSLSVHPPQEGEDCSMPATANEGTNSVPSATSEYYWYSFTMPDADSKIVITTTSQTTVYALSGTCEDYSILANGEENLTVAGLEAGEEILIVWEIDGNGNFDWELAIEPLDDGDICSLAVTASEGTNSAPHAPYWYSFTMPEAGDLTISSLDLTTEDTYLEVYSDCDGALLGTNDDFDSDGDIYQSQLTIPGMEAGETVHLYWSGKFSTASFDWKLSVSEPGPGSTCSLAIIATDSTNTASIAPAWYVFTMAAAGDLTISSVGLTSVDTDLKVYTDCEETLLAENDDFDDNQSEVTITGLKARESVYIYWASTWSSKGFDWSINAQYTAPIITDQTFTLKENSPAGTVLGTIVATAINDKPLAFSISNGNQNSVFALDTASGELSVADETHLVFETNPVFSLTVEVSDGEVSSSASVTINLEAVSEGVLESGPEETAELSVYPNPASGLVTIKAGTTLAGMEASLIDMSGRVLKTFTVKPHVLLDIRDLRNGVYLLKVQRPDGITVRRITRIE